MRLSISIPTYNREKYLKECLDSVVNQINTNDDVEIIVCDNASNDGTNSLIKTYTQKHSFIKYFRNDKNLGYTGNQIKCIENSSGDYIAILCDDDLYVEGEVKRILEVINADEYAFIALNYYAFVLDPKKPIASDFAPENDVIFKRAYDVMNYPSVGHYSGLVFNGKLAKKYLKEISEVYSFKYLEKMRGIIGILAICTTSFSNLESYFVGKRLLAARIPNKVDYDWLYHQCIDYYELYLDLFERKVINDNDLAYRKALVSGRLPKAIITCLPLLKMKHLPDVYKRLNDYFSGNRRFDLICKPLLFFGRFTLFRLVYSIITLLVRFLKKTYRMIHG